MTSAKVLAQMTSRIGQCVGGLIDYPDGDEVESYACGGCATCRPAPAIDLLDPARVAASVARVFADADEDGEF